MKHSLLESYVGWLERARWLVVAGVVVIALAAALGIRLLTFDASYEAFFSERNPQLSAHHAFQRIYSRSDNILVVLAPAEGGVFTRETLVGHRMADRTCLAGSLVATGRLSHQFPVHRSRRR